MGHIELVALSRIFYKTADASADAYFVQTVLFSWTKCMLFSYIFMLKLRRIYVSFEFVLAEGNVFV